MIEKQKYFSTNKKKKNNQLDKHVELSINSE